MSKKIEGVTYYRYRVCFRDQHGVRRRWMRWAPAPQFLAEAITRELSDYGLPAGSDVRIEAA